MGEWRKRERHTNVSKRTVKVRSFAKNKNIKANIINNSQEYKSYTITYYRKEEMGKVGLSYSQERKAKGRRFIFYRIWWMITNPQ